MADYPVMLQLEGRRCVIVGAGPVGQRKLQTLMTSGAEIVLIAPEAGSLNLPDRITVIPRAFQDTDLERATLVFAATNQAGTNQQIANAARARQIPVNIADDPQGSDFTLPAVCRQEHLTVAVSTNGQSPAAAAVIRDTLQDSLGPGWASFVKIAAKLRHLQLTREPKALYNQQVLQNLLERGLIQMLETGDRTGLEELFASQFAGTVSLTDFDISLPKGAT